VGIVIIAIVSLSIANYIYIDQPISPGCPPTPPYFILTTTENETCWRITVTNVSLGDTDIDSLPGGEVGYLLLREGNYTDYTLEHKQLSQIDGSASDGYNVMWLDNDNNNLLSKGDAFIISKSGGSQGKAMPGDRFMLMYSLYVCAKQVL